MLLDKTISQLLKGYREKEFTPKDVVSEIFENIEKNEEKINSFVTLLDKKEILEKFKDIDLSLPLAGIPYVLKDCYVTKGIKTTASSKILEDFIPPYNATVYEKLISAGAILIGKTNMDAWGHGGSTENTDFGVTHNPWDLTRVPGGSAGGCGVAIAARFCTFAIGEDTGGSIRNPAAWNNVTGLKVTYGRVSRYGAIAYASSFDTVGPMAKTIDECAYVLQIIAGKDILDATSSNEPVPNYLEPKTAKKFTLGIPKEFFGNGLDKEVKASLDAAVTKFQELGVETKEISMPLLEYAIPVYYIIAPSETSSNLGRYDGIRFGSGRENFTNETKRRIMIGTYSLSAGYYDAYYKKAEQLRTLFIEEYRKALLTCDAILMPISPTPPTKIGELINDPVQNLLADIFTTSQPPAGVPCLAIPCGFTKNKLPIGMQLVGNMFSENILFELGNIYQNATSWHLEKPKL
ncbi:Asp-tRNA(Asn)/Glu-tRNA(Gln) amidotransferase subunit GatA [Candidatus Microgenomates bacterium]|nr:Asp-tRNA(Asn)/Glu-tRNA(Gln) amidotransferase subunit GatA [Candidatus Microgenomates bacterium]